MSRPIVIAGGAAAGAYLERGLLWDKALARYLPLSCPQCQRELQVRAEYLNRRVSCNHCQHTFPVTGSPGASPPEAPNLAPRAEALEQEPRQPQASLDTAQAERCTAGQQP